VTKMFKAAAPEGAPPVVTISSGQVEGELCYSGNGSRVFSSFNGIPFAKPPLGKYRFLRPQPVDKWDGVLKCTRDKSFIQINMFREGNPQEGKEDGLVVNVNSPDLSLNKKMPVMVWIHGGGFTSGNGNRSIYGMHHFMDRDVVMVSFNYRLAVLGGLYLDREKVVGNQGLRDQICALQWVQENIGSFGGDKERVTIFGESAGGMSVMDLLLSPAAKGLFSAAIAMSGSPLTPFVGLDKHPKFYGRKFVEKMGGNPDDSIDDILSLLQSKDAAEIQEQTNLFEEFIRAPMPFKPIVDKDLVDDPVLPDEPIDLIKSGKFNKVPLIIGTNRNEGLLIKAFYERNPGGYDQAFDNWAKIGPLAFFHREADEYTKEQSEICTEYVKKYFGDTRFGSTGKGSEMLVQMYGDLMFTAPTDVVSKMLDDQIPVFQYIYNHQGAVSLYDVMLSKPWQLAVKIAGIKMLGMFKSTSGVCHADELFMMFKGKMIPDVAVTEQDRRVRKTLVNMWVNFATDHNPTPDGSWKKFNAENPEYLEIGSDKDEMKYTDDHRERMKHWEEIYKKVPCTMRNPDSKTWK